MKISSIIVFILAGLVFINPVQGQSYQQNVQQEFSQALELYEQFEFEQAAERFSAITMPEAQLFAGKSFYALGRYQSAKESLLEARRNASSQVYHEAGYTLALALLNARELAPAFDVLDEIIRESPDDTQKQLSKSLFEAFNHFLLRENRVLVVNESERITVKEELILYGVRNSSREDGEYFIQQAVQMQMGSEFINKLYRNQTYLIDNIVFEPQVPDGFIYNIGVLLPQQERDSAPYRVSREIYYGLLMAVDQFNSDQDNVRIAVKVAIATEDSTVEDMFYSLIEEHQADVIFGPLFSQDAALVAKLSLTHNIPVIAPLANSDEIAESSPYFFQANPTFATRGRAMADVAIQKLGYKELAILVDRNSTGSVEALAFRDRINEHGGELVHYFDVDFRTRRFDVSDYTRHFAGSRDVLEDTTITLLPVDAVFMPFTGSASNTMIDIVLTDLQAFRSRVSIIGTEDWGINYISPDAISRFNIVYSGIFNRNMESESSKEFLDDYRSRFGQEADLFAMHGYDNGQFIIEAVRSAVHPSSLADYFREMPLFKGIGQNIHYNGKQVNQAIVPRLLTQSGYLPIE